ncbi:hypothetical protein GGR50DRAFT_692546 [Xylaria sp. CBS 124048]|nr:hypothetical protein GGR50DRAFT_692546 [Xylaria sp. CBS 124048]
MNKSTDNPDRGLSPRYHRKRSHRCDDADADERRVRRRSVDYPQDRDKPRSRSRSPRRLENTHSRSRPRSPTRHRHRGRHRRRHASATSHQNHDQPLPFNAPRLSRSADLDRYRALFAHYLDIQKQIDIATLDEREIRGRWKSFADKWNNGELAEGWYRPEALQDAILDMQLASNTRPEDGNGQDISAKHPSQECRSDTSARQRQNIHTPKNDDNNTDAEVHKRADTGSRSRDAVEGESEDEDDDYGPTLPTENGSSYTARSVSSQAKYGAAIPTISDLTVRREIEASDRQEAREMLRQERKADRSIQKERLEELVPRATDPRARQLEKKREAREANASFAKAKASNDMPEIPDADLMGGEGGGVEEYKRIKREAERRKSEREVRREEVARAKREERAGRIKEYKQREAHTVDMLRELAKSRFG